MSSNSRRESLHVAADGACYSGRSGEVGSEKMGEVVVDVELENSADRTVFERGHGQASDIRGSTVEAIVRISRWFAPRAA